MGLILVAILQVAIAATLGAGFMWLIVSSDNPGLTAWLAAPVLAAAALIWQRNGWL